MKQKNYNAVKIGAFCIFTYHLSYCARNVLSVVTPYITEEGAFTTEYVGMMMSIYLVFYASGQLVNGIMGERIHPKYMVSIGCLLCGIGLLLFPLLPAGFIHMASYAVLGFGLSMLRGPLMKIISENTPPKEARLICTLFSVASFAGPVVVSTLALVLQWRLVFYIVSAFAFGIAVFSYVLITRAEKKGIIKFTPRYEKVFGELSKLFKIRHFMFYFLVAAIVEISGSSISFWTPTYLTDYVALSSEMTAGVYSLISLTSVFCPLLSVFLFEYIVKDDVNLNSLFFAIAGVAYLLLLFTSANPVLNIIIFIVAKCCLSCASATLWSIYIPGLSQHGGSVSIGHGVLDVTGYVAAAIANLLFTEVLANSGWGVLIWFWVGMAAIGFVGTLICKIKEAGK